MRLKSGYEFSERRLMYVRTFFHDVDDFVGTVVAQWLRCCVTNRKVAGSIPAGVIGIFH